MRAWDAKLHITHTFECECLCNLYVCVYVCARVLGRECQVSCTAICRPTPMNHNMHTSTSKPGPSIDHTRTRNPRLPKTQHDPASAPRSATQRRPCSQSITWTQSHVQYSQPFHTPQASRNGTTDSIVMEQPDATARGISVVAVWCTAMIHACLGC